MDDRKRRGGEKDVPKSRVTKEKKESTMKGSSKMAKEEKLKEPKRMNKRGEATISAPKKAEKGRKLGEEENGQIKKLERRMEEEKGKKGKKEEEKTKKKEEDKMKKKKEEEKVKKKEEIEEEFYEDDFEDYESDFEADEEEEENGGRGNVELAINGNAVEEESLLLKKLAAARKNNENSGNNRDQSSFGTMMVENGEMPPPKAMEFVEQQRELSIVGRGGRMIGEEEKGMERSKERMMDYYREMAGQNEHRKQMGTQTDGPEMNVGCQTEMPKMEERQIQSGEMIGQEERPTDQRKRLTFLKEAGQLLIGLLNIPSSSESFIIDKNHSNYSSSNLLPFSAGHSILSLNSLFKAENRLCAIALKNPQTICLCVYVTNSDDPMQMRKSFGAELSLENPKSIGGFGGRLIFADHEIVFLRYSPDASFLFAALKDGSLVAWDLLNCDETQMKGSKFASLPTLRPIANTAFDAFSADELDKLDVQKMGENWADLGIIGMEMLKKGRVGEGRIIAQLVVLHESGLLRCWTASEEAAVRTFEMDGSSPKTKLQLMATSSARCIPNSSGQTISEFATCLAICAQSSTTTMAFVGTSKGRILRVNPTNGKADWRDGPSIFIADPDGNSEVTSIKLSPFGSNEVASFFAAATMDQRILLFNLTKAEPHKIVRGISNANHHHHLPILLEWSSRDKSILYSIHAGEEILVLRGRDDGNVFGKEQFQFYREFRSRIHSTLAWTDQFGNAFLAFGLSNGEMHVHSIK